MLGEQWAVPLPPTTSLGSGEGCFALTLAGPMHTGEDSKVCLYLEDKSNLTNSYWLGKDNTYKES